MSSLQKILFEKYHKKIYNFNNNNYQFDQILKKIYNVDNLQNIYTNENKILCNFENDQMKPEIIHFYKSPLFNDFVEEYQRFITEEVRQIFSDESFIVYQTKPTFRIQEPNNIAVGEWHKDTNPGYNHSFNEINFFLPFTPLNKYNTIWMNKNMEDDDDNIEPILIDTNQYTSNYLANVKHGNIINESPCLRISIDFRIIPGSLYNENINTTYDSKKRMIIGDYFSKL